MGTPRKGKVPSEPLAEAKRKAEQDLADTRDAKVRFDAAHRKGMKALESGDYEALDEAIKAESEAIDALPRSPDARKRRR